MKPTAPGSYFSYICLAIYFSFAFLFRSIKPKNTKIPRWVLFLFILFGVRSINLLQFTSRPFAYLRRRTPEGIDNPFNTSGCEYLLFVCRCCLRGVRMFSYCFDKLGLITEGNTYRRYIASSLPLWGNTDVVLADINHLPPMKRIMNLTLTQTHMN